MSPFHKLEQRELETELDIGKVNFKRRQYTISKSALEKFFSGCTYRYPLYQKWNLKEEYMPAPLRKGIAAHSAIEKLLSGENDGKIADELGAAALRVAERAQNWLDKNGYTVLALEVAHIAPLTDEIQLFGVIDCIALNKEDEPVQIDWKTSYKPWTQNLLESGERVYIDAQGWQGAVYLTVPYESDILEVDAWPITMEYVIIPTQGTVAMHPYHKSTPDDQALIAACQQLAEAKKTGSFPKNKGWQCRNCDFKKVCWGTPGWEKYYEARR